MLSSLITKKDSRLRHSLTTSKTSEHSKLSKVNGRLREEETDFRKQNGLGGITMFFDLQVAVWDGSFKAGKVQLQEKLLIKEANRQREEGTDVRSNWRTPGETWEEVAS